MKEELCRNTSDTILECSNCCRRIKPGDKYAIEDDETVLCVGCYDHARPKCEFCGKRVV